MLLFYNQWRDVYPNAIIDTDTKNKSFLRYAMLLKEMGIKNHGIFLQLHNKELKGIDPYDPKLSIEQMMMVAAECKINPFIILEKYLETQKVRLISYYPLKLIEGTWLYIGCSLIM